MKTKGPEVSARLTLAKFFFGLSWLLPLVCLLGSPWTGDQLELLLGRGVGLTDSSRIVLFVLSGLAALCSWELPSASSGSTVKVMGSLFLGWVGLAILFSGAPFDSFLFAQVWFSSAFIYFAATRFTPQLEKRESRLLWLHLPVIILAVHALVPVLTQEEVPRIGGFFDLAGVYATWAVMVLPLCLIDGLKPGKTGLTGMVASVLLAVSVYFTLSRAGWLLLGLEIPVICTMLDKLERKTVIRTGLILLAGLVVVVSVRGAVGVEAWLALFACVLILPIFGLLLNGLVTRSQGRRLLALTLLTAALVFGLQSRIVSSPNGIQASDRLRSLQGADNSSRARVELWKSGLAMTLDYPMFGVGPGNFSTYYPQYQQNFYYYSDSTHNTALEMSSEIGLPGCAFFFAFIGLLLSQTWQAKETTALQRGSAIGLIFGLAYGMLEVSYHFGAIWLVGAVLAANVSLSTKVAVPSRSVSAPWRKWAQAAGAVGLLGFGAYFYPPVHWLETARQESDPARSLALVESAYSRLKWSRRATMLLFQHRLDSAEPAPELGELVPRLQTLAASYAPAHALLGEYFLGRGDYPKARQEMETALRLDPNNHPDYYHWLLQIASKTGDQALIEQVTKDVLQLYVLPKLELAPSSHQLNLKNELHPLLYDLADTLNPFYAPGRTEPIYRYLWSQDKSARAAYGLGVSLWSQQNYAEGRAYLHRAHNLNPQFPPPPR